MKKILSMPALVIALGVVGGGAQTGCFKNAPAPQPANQVLDVASAIQCNEAHWGEPFPQIVADCWKGDAQAAADGIADLELLFEQQASQADAGAALAEQVRASFPYKNEAPVAKVLAAKRLKLAVTKSGS